LNPRPAIVVPSNTQSVNEQSSSIGLSNRAFTNSHFSNLLSLNLQVSNLVLSNLTVLHRQRLNAHENLPKLRSLSANEVSWTSRCLRNSISPSSPRTSPRKSNLKDGCLSKTNRSISALAVATKTLSCQRVVNCLLFMLIESIGPEQEESNRPPFRRTSKCHLSSTDLQHRRLHAAHQDLGSSGISVARGDRIGGVGGVDCRDGNTLFALRPFARPR
jgi:hypothetical protein